MVSGHVPQPWVFVVEQNKVVRSSIIKRLKREKFPVQAFESGESLLDTLRHAHPDVVLLDYDMPGLTGEQTLEEMHKMGLCFPVVLLTAHGDRVKVSTRNYQGSVVMVTKSLELEDIVRVVQGAMTA